MSGRPPVVFRYDFQLASGRHYEFELRLDGETLMLPPVDESSELPEWTRLRHRQCSNCPLRESEHPRCPVAVQTIPVVEAFRTHLSHEIAAVEVDSPNRVYRRNASLQEALSSLLGIHMVASGCPVLGKLRPMLTTHLPFMSSEESTFRLVSTYLLAQYVLAADGVEPDWELSGLVAFLHEARIANAGFCRRLGSIGVSDASLNALSVLSALGEVASLTILDADLGRWRTLFHEHYRRRS